MRRTYYSDKVKRIIEKRPVVSTCAPVDKSEGVWQLFPMTQSARLTLASSVESNSPQAECRKKSGIMQKRIILFISLGLFVFHTPAGLCEESGETGNLPAKMGLREVALDPDLLKSVRQKTMGISSEESNSYYWILEHAGAVNAGELKAAARRFQEKRRSELTATRENPKLEFPTFVDMFQNPERYLGQPVTLRGHVRRIVKYSLDKKHPGAETQYEAWIYTQNSQTNPAVIVFTSLPRGMPMGDNILERVAVTGYFFKLYGYEARDTTRLAPLILASRLEWFPGKTATEQEISPVLFAAVAGAVLIALVVILWLIKRTAYKDRQFRGSFLNEVEKSEGVNPQE